MTATAKIPILVADDHEVTRLLLKEVLEKEGYRVTLAASGEKAVDAIRAEGFAIVLSDIRMAALDGMAVLREARQTVPAPVVILMTGFGSMEGAIEAIQEGAFDYISKPFKIDHLKSVVARAVKHWELLREQVSAGAPGAATTTAKELRARALIGKSPRIVEVYKTVARAAMSMSTVLVSGESGTGKELVARAIHANSPRREGKFIVFNCSSTADPAALETELFHHFQEAHGGTLFLDEIATLPPPLQFKLLRTLQEGEIRLAGSPDPVRIDVRVIAANREELGGLVKAGRFREDLFYRLKVISIELPPLRERIEDLPDLVGHFVALFAARNRKSVSHVSDEALGLLKAYSWPGNVRELEHAIERAVAMTNTSVLFPEDFPPEISQGASGFPSAESGTAPETAAADSLEEMEKAHILKVLQEVGFNKSRASEVLGIDRATLYRKAQRYGIDLKGK